MFRCEISLCIVAAMVWPSVVAAESLTAVCEALTGPRIDYERSGTQAVPHSTLAEESISGVASTFFVDLTKKTVTAVIGSTVYPGMTREQVEKIAPTKAKRLPIVHVSERQITALDSSDGGVWVYSLFPSLGYGLITRQTHSVLMGENAVGSLMPMVCKFQ
jgi:hypothetical protein